MGVCGSCHREQCAAAPVLAPIPGLLEAEHVKTVSGRKRALLVGINYIGKGPDLRGCVNDIENQKQVLTTRYGFSQDDFMMLSDGIGYPVSSSPTKARIEEGFKWLMDGAALGDLLFFAYSGHGTNVGGAAGTPVHEAICPLDCFTGKWPQTLILDTQIHETFYNQLPSGVRCVCLFDCCHSGRIAELNIVRSQDVAGNRFLPPPPDALDADSLVLLSALPDPVGLFPTRQASDQLWVYSGCQDDQTSADANIKGEWQGAFTWAFLDTLSKHKSITYLELLEKTKRLLRKNKYSQVPALGTTVGEYLKYDYLALPSEIALVGLSAGI